MSDGAFNNDHAPPDDVYVKGMERLVTVAQELSLARSLAEVQSIVRTAARELTGADGATLVLRQGELCFYADEDAIAPLWKGLRFPMSACISGWAMLHRRSAVIEDIYQDPRIPADAYRPTFVKSLVMVPIRTTSPIGAIGNYWARQRTPSEAEVKLLQALADSTSIALENVQLYAELEGRVRECTEALQAAQRAEAERKRTEAELSKAQAQLRQAQKMEAIGQLAAGIAHDFNNVLSVVVSYGCMIAQALPKESPLRGDASEIVAAGERATALTQQLLAFSRKQVLDPRPVSLDAVLSRMQNMLQRLVGSHVQLAVEHDPALFTTFADPTQLEQVLMNLVVNARDAMPEGGNLRISTKNASFGAESAARFALRAGDYAAVSVSDTGMGMPEAVRDRVFEPFFTTKEKGKGTGLGLSTAYGIVKQSGGHIAVESEPGKGTTFTVYLPRDLGVFVTPPSAAE